MRGIIFRFRITVIFSFAKNYFFDFYNLRYVSGEKNNETMKLVVPLIRYLLYFNKTPYIPMDKSMGVTSSLSTI